ncbi:MAG: hypothetical protein CFH31_00939 [Alphaproteobacteria bacterium MarineAlpha9_Bin1]|nr:MAG: hypothetical protein CFH31_00939 [Alphaproteobacteria bacterium MarineAlpha9_Bin1]
MDLFKPSFKLFIILIFSFFITLKAFSIEEKDAVSYVTEIGFQAINILKTPIEDIVTREKLFREMFNSKFDKKLIHRAVLGKAAKGVTKEELSRFGKAFDEHIIKIYASQLGVYSDQLFVVDKTIKRDRKDTIVLTHIEHATAPPLRIDWRLRDRGKGPKIIDIAIEGVSLLATKRADFSSTIKKGGIHLLINDLEEKNSQK